MRQHAAIFALFLFGGVFVLGLLALASQLGPGVSQADDATMHNCPEAGKWAIAVWDGDDETEAEQAFATCGEQAMAAAYYLDPQTQGWLRWVADRPEITTLLTLDDMQGVFARGVAPPPPPPTPKPTAMPAESINLMTYNILAGGGVPATEPDGAWCCGPLEQPCCDWPDWNRLPGILEVIRAADPDILAIQEASFWQLDDESIARQVAAELGMNYLLAVADDGGWSHVALFTKFEIKNAKTYPTQFADPYGRAGLYAEVVTPGGRSIHVFVVHLRPENGVAEVTFLIEEMSPYFDDLTVLMGDMNFHDVGIGEASDLALMLRGAGWHHPLAEHEQGVDHIWTSPALAPYVQWVPEPPLQLTAGTSDHFPTVAKIELPASQ